MSCIIDNLLYVGDCEDAQNYSLLKQLNIKYVVNATKDLPDYFCDLPYMQYLSVPAEDSPTDNLLFYFDKVAKFISSAKAHSCAVLIHCHAGISRSATLAIAYVMKTEQMTANEACLFVKQRRQCIAPNPGFMKQLMEFEAHQDICFSP